MNDYLKFALISIAVSVIYYAGYERAETKGELAIESIKRSHAQAIVDAQLKEQQKYEQQIADLVSKLNALGTEHADRMFELEQFRSSRGSLEACYRQRDDLAELAVRGERLLKRAVTYLSVQ